MNPKLLSIFGSLRANDVITTKESEFVVCREISYEEVGKAWRYVIGNICKCSRHCTAILPVSYAWNYEKNAFCGTDGNPLPGWDEDVTVERNSYTGRDKDSLHFIRLSEELGDDNISDDKLDDIATLSVILSQIVQLSPNPRGTWRSISDALGLQLSERQVLALATASQMLKSRTKVAVAIVDAEILAGPEPTPKTKH